MNFLDALKLFPRLIDGRFNSKYENKIQSWKSKSLTVESYSPMKIHVDGEIIGENPQRVEISITNRKLKVLALV